MPTYQYVCTDCGSDLEAVQSFTDAALTECPSCGGKLRKRFSAVGVVFKGSGFYRTDSRSGSSTSAGEKKAEKPAAESAPAAKSDSSSSSSSSSSTSSTSSTSSSSSSSSGSSPAGAAA